MAHAPPWLIWRSWIAAWRQVEAVVDPEDGPSGGGGKRKKGKKAAGPQTTEADAEFGVSRGVDFCDVTAVVNMDLPTSLEVYRHRIGRTARAGATGTPSRRPNQR